MPRWLAASNTRPPSIVSSSAWVVAPSRFFRIPVVGSTQGSTRSGDSVAGTNPILKPGKIDFAGNVLAGISLRGFSRVQAFHLTAVDGFGDPMFTLDALSICIFPGVG